MSEFISVRPFEAFAEFSLPLYSGPQVTIHITPADHEYKLSKALVCEHSPVFRHLFDASIGEDQEQSITLHEEDGVVSIRSFRLLVQWMYVGRVVLGNLGALESLNATIEFARTADLYGVTGMEMQMADHIRALINGSSPPDGYEFDSNTYLIDSKHIVSATRLHQGHPVRQILAAASVKGYFKKYEHKFVREVREIPTFASDLLQEVKIALETLRREGPEVLIIDPISNRRQPVYTELLDERDRG